MKATYSLQYLVESHQGEHNLQSAGGDTLIVILMATGFVFDPLTHSTLADVSADELAAGNGYTQQNEVLTGVTVTRDEVNNRALISCDDPIWTPDGGNIGPTAGAIVYNSSHINNTIVCCIEYQADHTAVPGQNFGINFTNGLADAKLVIAE